MAVPHRLSGRHGYGRSMTGSEWCTMVSVGYDASPMLSNASHVSISESTLGAPGELMS
jgi:hypothetical protein